MKVADIMSREVIMIRGVKSVARAIAAMREHQMRSLIVDRRHPEDAYGIVTETDIVGKVVAYGQDPQRVRVYEIMSKPCIGVSPDLQLEYAARLMAQHDIRVCPVMDSQLQGILSMTDILMKGDFAERPQTQLLDQQIQVAIANAQAICSQEPVDLAACLVAWRQVEDLQAEAAYHRAMPLAKTAFEEFRETVPAWFTDQDYETWCSG